MSLSSTHPVVIMMHSIAMIVIVIHRFSIAMEMKLIVESQMREISTILVQNVGLLLFDRKFINMRVIVFIYLSFFLDLDVNAQIFQRCSNIISISPINLKYLNNRIFFSTLDTLFMASESDFKCDNNKIVEIKNGGTFDFYPISENEFLVTYNYKSLVIYNIETQEIKKILINDSDGLYNICKRKESTYIGSEGKYYVNHDNMMTDVWDEIQLITDTYVVEMNFITDDFFIFCLGRSEGKGGIALTNDGGQNWRVDTLGFDQRVTDIEYLGGNQLIAIGNGGDIYLSENMGLSWTKKIINPEINFLYKSETVGTDVYVVGGKVDISGNFADAYAFRSLDNGKKWDVVFYKDTIGEAVYLVKDLYNKLYFSTSDGSIFYTKEPVSSTLTISTEKLTIFPNPTASSFKIGTSNDSDLYKVMVLDVTGSVVMTASDVRPLTEIDISHFPAGLYLLHIINDKGIDHFGKLIKTDY